MSLIRSFARALTPRLETSLSQSTRAFSLGGLKGYDDKEAAEEALFFKKEEERVLRKLLAKVRAQANQSDVHGSKGAEAEELSQLESILVKYKVSEADKKALLDWKHSH